MMIFSILLACAPKSSNEGIDTGATDNTNDTLPPIPSDDLPASQDCEMYNDILHPGASTYFAGTYLLEGDELTGVEEAIYVANSTWEDILGAPECRIRWSLTGTVLENSACTTCDLHVEVNAIIDESQSDCPSELGAEWQSTWTEIYGIARNDDGSSSWYYGSNGNQFSNGEHNGSQLTFLTDVQCSWF